MTSPLKVEFLAQARRISFEVTQKSPLTFQAERKKIEFFIGFQGVVGGEANIGFNLGSGAGVFKNKTGSTLNFKSLTGSGGIQISNGVDEIDVGFSAGGGFVPTSRVLTAGAGLTGGGDLSDDRTFDVGAGSGIVVNADDVAADFGGAPADVTKATASAGVSSQLSRADHKHDVETAIAGTIAVGDTASEGIASSLARSDHLHALPAPAAPVNVTKAAASAGVATTVARADHKHDVNTAAPGSITIGSAASEGVSTSLARADHVHGLAAPSEPANVSKSTALTGTSGTPARSDHKHDINTGAAGTIAVGNTALEGTATTLARSDHVHALPAPTAPVNVTKAAAAAGVATTVARADHKHDVTTAAASALNANLSSTEGTATSLARSDHTHSIDTAGGTISTIQPDDAAAEGTGTGFSRRDHRHAIVAAAGALGIGGGNTEGVATSFSRSDHDHAIRETGAGQELTVGVVSDNQLVERSGTSLVGRTSITSAQHGDQALGDGLDHAAATVAVNGFMSAADKAKSNAISLRSGAALAAAFSGDPQRATVTLATPFASTAYSVEVSPVVSGALTFAPNVESKATGSFVINLGTKKQTGLTQVDWLAIAHGEAV